MRMALLVVAALVTGAQASAAALVEDKAAYLARCRQETLAQIPGAMAAQLDSICSSKWDMILETGPMADAMLALVPDTGATFDPDDARALAASVKWGAKQKNYVAFGRLGEVAVGVARKPVLGVTFSWFKEGTPIPFDLEGALRVRGVALAMVGCLSFGSAEGSHVYRATAAGKAPFALTVAAREAALASQSSDYSATADSAERRRHWPPSSATAANGRRGARIRACSDLTESQSRFVRVPHVQPASLRGVSTTSQLR
jgi:hypothetical protein